MDTFPAPEVRFDDGDVVPLLLSTGRYEGTITTGNAFSRHALDAILPMPEQRFLRGADGYVCTLAPLFGAVRSVEQRLGAYIRHGANHSDFARQLPQRLRWQLEHDAARHEALRAKAAELGLRTHPEPGLNDAFHLENRIGSLCLDPANHPTPADFAALARAPGRLGEPPEAAPQAPSRRARRVVPMRGDAAAYSRRAPRCVALRADVASRGGRSPRQSDLRRDAVTRFASEDAPTAPISKSQMFVAKATPPVTSRGGGFDRLDSGPRPFVGRMAVVGMAGLRDQRDGGPAPDGGGAT